MRNFLFLLFFVGTLVSMNAEVRQVKASYYADKFHGRKTANGTTYHRDSLTCAHKTLPFGTVLRVTNPKNDKTVYVTVTDRGPFIKGRSVDLSYAAAKAIGTINAGVSNVVVKDLGVGYDLKTEERVRYENLSFIKLPNLSTITVQDNTKIMMNDLLTLSLNNPILIKAV